MWLVIILIILAGLILLGYFSHVIDLNNRAKTNGGMLNKYKTLIKSIQNEDPKINISKVSERSVIMRSTNMDGSTIFVIKQDVDSVIIEWKVNSKVFGAHRLGWQFPDYIDQNNMLSKINSDVTEKNFRILNRFTESTTSYDSSENERQISLSKIASKLNCDPSNSKQEYFNNLKKLGFNESDKNDLLDNLEAGALNESKLFNMKSENTPSAIYKDWTIEWFNELEKTRKTASLQDEDLPF